MGINKPYTCKECSKEIWAFNDITTKPGVEDPIILHAVCYERLKEFVWMYKELD
jgi:hypothetical protein